MQVDALVAALTPLLQDEALRARMGAAARRRVTTEFALETQAARVLRLYERLVGGAS
jgi:glycosyltransferase involved in cell wall biosynthesis